VLGVSIFAAGPADAPLASDNDNPAAAPSTGTAFLKRLRFEACLACDMVETFHTLGIPSLAVLRVFRLNANPAFPVRANVAGNDQPAAGGSYG